MPAGATTTPRPFRAAGTTEALRTAALGANLWTIALLLPVVHGGARGALDAILVALPLVPLAIGALALAANGDRRARGLAIATLLFTFPVTLAGVLAARADLADRDAWGAIGLSIAALSLLAYGAVAAEACARPLTLRTSTAQALTSVVATAEPLGRTWLRRAVLASTIGGGLLIAVVAPAAGSRATLVRAWGESADEATVLASIVGASVSAIAIAALLGPRLRAARAGELPSASRRTMRIAAALSLATLGLAGYVMLRVLDVSR
ncbi:MAG: hypothetical protein M3Y87_32565 [Myxococcota bacterium]|nr:hypothetical protein [Myxococcota bacterium]